MPAENLATIWNSLIVANIYFLSLRKRRVLKTPSE